MKYFQYDKDNGTIELENESLLLIKEIQGLLEPKRNITKTDKTGKKKQLAFKELKYIYLFFDWDSPYFSYADQQKHAEALKDSEMTADEFEDQTFRSACRVYDEIQNSNLSIQMLKSAQNAVRAVIDQFNSTDLSERDPISGKPIFKNKDVIAEIKGCKDLIVSLRELEVQVKRGLETESNVRGNTELGMFD
jgi:hypothetical protein